MLTRLSEAADAGSVMDPKDLLRLILEAATTATHADFGTLHLIDPADGRLRVEVATGLPERIYDVRLQRGEGITGWVLANQQPLRIDDVRRDSRYLEIDPDVRSQLTVPLLDNDAAIGVVSVGSRHTGAFSNEDETVLESLAAQSARVIQNQAVYERIRRQARGLETLSSVTMAVAGSLDLDSVLEEVVNHAARLTEARLASLLLLDPQNNTLSLRAVSGSIEDYRKRPPLRVEGSLTGQVLLSGQPLVVRDVRQESGFRMLELAEREGLCSLLVVPLLWRERAIGALNVYTSEPHDFTQDEIRLLTTLAAHSAIAIENARLHGKTLESEEALRSADRLAILGELAAGVAHEIRNPLTTMNVVLHALERDQQLQGNAAEDLEMLKRQTERLEQIVERFLGLVRAKTFPKQPVRLAEAVAETCMLLQHQVAQRGVQLWADISPTVPEWPGDPLELGQVLYNLTLNAVQACGDQGGGEVVLRVRQDEPEAVVIEVADTGPGLPELVREKLFQPFVTTREKGVGLGLSIVHRLVQRHGGTVSAEERKGGGTVFRVVLPLE